MERISPKDQIIMDRIIDVSKLISNIYQRMFFESTNENINNKNYELLINNLKHYIVTEKHLYNSLGITPEKASFLIDYFMVTDKKFQSCTDNVLQAIYCDDFSKLYSYRIINKLVCLSFQNRKKYLEWLMEDGAFFNPQNAVKYIKTKNFERVINIDFEKRFLYYLNNYLDEEITPNEREKITRIKYNLYCISSDMESDLLDNKKTNDDLMLHPFIGELEGFNRTYCDDILIEKSSIYCSNAIRAILIKDSLVDEAVKSDFNLFSMYFKAGLSLPTETTDYASLLELFELQILDANDETNNSLSIATDVLLQQIDSMEREKEKIKYLHIIPRGRN